MENQQSKVSLVVSALQESLDASTNVQGREPLKQSQLLKERRELLDNPSQWAAINAYLIHATREEFQAAIEGPCLNAALRRKGLKYKGNAFPQSATELLDLVE